MALCPRPWFRPVSKTRKRGGRSEEERKQKGGKEVWVSFPGHCGLLEVQEEPLINYDHYNHHLCQGH